MLDYYAILGVARNATPNEIRDAYLKLARNTHPDLARDPEARKTAEESFKYVTAAYDTLSKERSRREYTGRMPADESPRTGTKSGSSTPATRPGSTPPGSPSIASSGRAAFDALAGGAEAFKKQDYHTAVQLLTMAVSQDETNARAHALLSLAMAKNPNWVRDALNHMETASKLEPKNVSYLVELALLLHSQGLKLRARRTLESARAINPDHPDVARGLQEIPADGPPAEAPSKPTAETSRSLFDRLRKR